MQSTCSPLLVHELFRSLLSGAVPPDTAMASQPSPTNTSPRLTSPPKKNTIRFISNDPHNRREKYDGSRWRRVCTWNECLCTNLAYSNLLCARHNTQQRNREWQTKQGKAIAARVSLPIIPRPNYERMHSDDDIEILEELCQNATVRHSLGSTVKTELSDFHVFSVDHVENTNPLHAIKSEARPVSTHNHHHPHDVEYITSKTRANGLNITEAIAKNTPPLTDFEEEYIASRLIDTLPRHAPMIDAQLYLHNEAIHVVKKNYRLKMDAIAPEYFYDFLFRHPRVPIHFKHWFLRCKLQPPNTGCPIDTKVWSLAMIVRGATGNDRMSAEYD